MKLLLAFILTTFSLFAGEKISFFVPDGIPAISVAHMAVNNKVIDGYEMNYVIEKTPESLVNSILKEQADFAVVPSNLIGQISIKNIPYKVLGTAGWGALYLVSYKDLANFQDLKGSKIYAFGKGLTPDAAFRNILKKENIDADSLDISYVASPNELPPAVFSKKADFALVPEPVLSALLAKDKDLKIVMDLGSLWTFPQSSLIVKSSLAEKNINFVKAVVDDYSNSVSAANLADDSLRKALQELNIKTPVPITEEVIKRAKLKFVPAKDSLDVYRDYFNALYLMNPKSVGGAIPDEKIFILD